MVNGTVLSIYPHANLNTNYVPFQTKQTIYDTNFNVYIEIKQASEVKSANFLGVVTDSNLILEAYADKFCNRINANLHAINRLSRISELVVTTTITYWLVYPFLSYGITLWGEMLKNIQSNYL
jgi:hypothetical protein